MLKYLVSEAFFALFRYFEYPSPLGLVRVGRPGPASPVLVSGNYALTVQRLLRTLRGHHCHLLIANSRGSNVWCAAGMNEFTEFDLIDALTVSGLAQRVQTRRIIVPPYAAVGIDRDVVRKQTGFRVIWGPTDLKLLPRYLDAGCRRDASMVRATFPLLDRMEQAVSTAWSYTLTISPLLFVWPNFLAKVIGLNFLLYCLAYGALPLLPAETRWRRSLLLALLSMGGMAGAGLFLRWPLTDTLAWSLVLLGLTLLLVMDMCGSTPLYKTTLGHWLREGDYRCAFEPVVDPAACVNCMQCLLVCPRDVFAAVRHQRRTVVAVHPKWCEECLACIKQCPTDAIYNRGGALKDDIKSIPNLHGLMERRWGHLAEERKWENTPTVLRNEIPVVAPACPQPTELMKTTGADPAPHPLRDGV